MSHPLGINVHYLHKYKECISKTITKVRAPIPLGYVGFYIVYYWMILTTIL
jgi:hypothetical protein